MNPPRPPPLPSGFTASFFSCLWQRRLIVGQVSSTFRDKRREAELPNRETGLGAEPTPSRAGSKDFLWTKQPPWSIAKLIELAILLPWKNVNQEIMI